MAENKKLFDVFPPITTNEWKEKINTDLKGADFERKLVWKTNEGFNVQPYYRSEDLDNLKYLEGVPGEFPFHRGNSKDNNWLISQDILVTDVENANKKAQCLLQKGVNSLGFIIKNDITPAQIETLLYKINPEEVNINFISGNRNGWLTSLFAQYIEKEGCDKNKVYGSDDFDPLGHILKHGDSACNHDDCKCAENFFTFSKDKLPMFRLISVNARNVHNAGGSIVQELGIGLAMGAEYLDIFTNIDLPIEEITPKLQFIFASGSNYFMEIAKLRAARLLWAKIVNEYNPSNAEVCKIFIHTETSTWNKTAYDPYVNMLRTTTEAMSAAIGATDSMNVNPFNYPFTDSNEFSERIARNTQLILKEEAHLNKVTDPAAGSYYIENLTNSIAEQAWDIFSEIEKLGGFTNAFKKGYIQSLVEKTAQKRTMDIAMRKEILLGTNQFPNFSETIDKSYIQDRLQSKDSKEGKLGKGLKLFRGAEEFEKLRMNSETADNLPKVFILKIGNLNMRQARAQFASNFFGCAGFEINDPQAFNTIEDGTNEAFKYGADIVVICSSDDEYATLAPELTEKLNNKAIIVVAGNPKCKADLEAKGINNFIHVKSNILEDLTNYQKSLGIN